MKLILLHISYSLCLAMTMTLAISMSKPGCPETCGDVTIPYPFGIGSECSANSSFTVTCRNSTTPFLSSINAEALDISLHGIVTVNQPVSLMSCPDQQTTESHPISLMGSPFTISSRYNSLAVLGCMNAVWLLANRTRRAISGCMAICDAASIEYSCEGVNCCQATIPRRLQELLYTIRSIDNVNGSSCGYVFPVDKKWFEQDFRRYKSLHDDQLNPFDREFASAPLVLEWEAQNLNIFQNSICTNSSSSYLSENEYVSSTRYCSCEDGFEGNPYLPEGCSDIDECSNALRNDCMSGTCINGFGGYHCDNDRDENYRSRVKVIFISIGSAFGGLVLLIGAWKSSKTIRERIKSKRKRKILGLLLEQQLSSTENGLENTKLFSSKVLAQATDHYNENRILGRGGQGIVYKGMLTDGRIVAVKKSKRVEDGDLDVFVNEVAILSQINHRNVVKLLGCCVETEVPHLVYEFIPNGTLFQHIHHPNEEFPLSWEMRVRIAKDVAGALSYLHSAASAPIYHRDIKSTNILLDDKYRAKVSDFGTSRSVAIDQTHLTTRVLGTFGYLDPEYFQSSQFTEKSDVYSFGVVMVELLTGEKAVSSIKTEIGRSLATHFLHSMEENQLFDILDPRVLKGAKREEVVAIAELARRCLHLNGKRRPTMKEVVVKLEGIQLLEEGSNFLQSQGDNREYCSTDVAESYDFSSILGR